jgi:hypothetical protein
MNEKLGGKRMKKSLMLAFALVVVITIPGLASATHFTEVVGSADCVGWEAAATVYWRSTVTVGELDYSVILFDADGNEVTRAEWIGTVNRTTYPEQTYSYGGEWGIPLCGDFTIVGTVHISAPWEGGPEDDTMRFSSAFTCVCEEPGGCFLTPGYWKNHLDAWPQETLMLGGVEMSQYELLGYLIAPVRGDATVILARHLIASKLNVLNGADPSIQTVIDDADDYLAVHPVFSRPGKHDGRQDGLDLKDLLADFNEQGCEEDENLKEGETDTTSFGSLKAMYR